MVEIWKTIKGYEGLYEISSCGRVKSFKRERVVILKLRIGTTGHLRVNLYKNNHRSNRTVHRLVTEAFIPNPENKPEVNHKNGIKTDNKVGNLEWCTSSENALHAIKTGLWKIGSSHGRAKLTESNILQIKYLYGCLTLKELAAIYGVSKTRISRIYRGKNWEQVKVEEV